MLLLLAPHLLAYESLDLPDCLDVCFYSDMRIVSYKLLILVYRFRLRVKLPVRMMFVVGFCVLILESFNETPTLTNPAIGFYFETFGVSRFRLIDTKLVSGSYYVVVRFLLFSCEVLTFFLVNLL